MDYLSLTQILFVLGAIFLIFVAFAPFIENNNTHLPSDLPTGSFIFIGCILLFSSQIIKFYYAEEIEKIDQYSTQYIFEKIDGKIIKTTNDCLLRTYGDFYKVSCKDSKDILYIQASQILSYKIITHKKTP